MEKSRFIFKFFISLFLKSLIISIILIYFLGYLKVITMNSIKERLFYNPFTTEITYKENSSNIDNDNDNETEIVGVEYFVFIIMNGQERQVKISKEQYDEFQGQSYIEQYGERYKVVGFDKKRIEKIKTKKSEKKETIKTTYELTDHKIKENYIDLINYVFTDIFLNIVLIISVIFLMYRKIKFLKFYLLPYELNVFENFGTEQKQEKYYRYFIGKKGNRYLYGNKTKSPFEKFKVLENELLDKLNWNDIEISRVKNNVIKIQQMELPKSVMFNREKLKKDCLYRGVSKGYKDLYFEIEKISHTIIIGGTGSGKSVFLQNLLISFFYSIEKFERFVFVDFKRVELGRYRNKEKVQYINKIEDFYQIIKELKQIMDERLIESEGQNKRTSNRPFILIRIDEFRTIKNRGVEPKILKEIDKLMVMLLQQSRARNMRFIFRGQSRKSTDMESRVLNNITSRILLGTEDDDNISKMIGDKNVLEKMGLSRDMISRWEKGKGVYKDNDTKGSYIFQSPFFDVENQENWDFICSLLKDKNNNENSSVIENIQNENISKFENISNNIQNEKIQIENISKFEEVSKNEIVNINNLDKTEIERKLKEFWKLAENIENEKIRSEIRKTIQSRKRNYFSNNLPFLEGEMIKLSKFFQS